jgi:hypothetical protein
MSKTIYQRSGNKYYLYLYLKILTALLMILSSACCGKKGPPTAPDMLPLPSVTGLEAKLFNNSLDLIWTIQTGKGVTAPDGFRIYRSKKSPEDSQCPGCPDVFEKVSELATAFSLWGMAENRFIYRETLEDGYIYRYKVMAYTDSGLKSDWSDTVEVVAKSEPADSEN